MNQMNSFLLTVIVALITQSVCAKSKPVAGYTVYQIGTPNAGEPFTGKIPHGESAINSITKADNGLIFAGTRIVRGNTPWILCFDPDKKSIPDGLYWPIAPTIKGERSITALVNGADGHIYGATSNHENIDYKDFKSVLNEKYGGGHLFRFVTDINKIKIEDLGVPFSGEGISVLIADAKRHTIYGITSPSLILFSLSLADLKVKKLHNFGGVDILRNRYIGKAPPALVIDDSGNVYGSSNKGQVFKYSPVAESVSFIQDKIPTDGEGESYDVVTAFVKTKSGRIFGGTLIDGKLFELIPATGKIKPLGITGRSGNIRSIAEANSILFGFCGSKELGTRQFAFNIATGEHRIFPGFKVYFPNSSIKMVPYQLDKIININDSTFIISENSDNGHLFIYEPERMEWNN